MRIGIVGGGFSGCTLAAHLLRKAAGPLEIVLFERREVVGRGVAYSTQADCHLLNVRASNMSALPDPPDHFSRWLALDLASRGTPADELQRSGFAFVSRNVYGRYLQDFLLQSQESARPSVTLRTVQTEVEGIRERERGVDLGLSGGAHEHVDRAVLALGHFPPTPPQALRDQFASSTRCVSDPWATGALDSIDPDEPVMVLGTGLTMVDIVLTLGERGHRGRIVAVSRHGLVPIVHAPTHAHPIPLDLVAVPRTIRALLRRVWHEVSLATTTGGDWREVIDALRPHTQALWQELAPNERRRFLRHARAFWEVHRHRLAPPVAARIAQLRHDGRLSIVAGRITAIVERDSGLDVTIRPRRSDARSSVRVSHVINCTGAECDYARIRHPLVRSLLDSGLARPDGLRLGLDVTADNALVSSKARASSNVFLAGPPTRGRFWEITAVPEIRRQCDAIATRLSASSTSVGGSTFLPSSGG